MSTYKPIDSKREEFRKYLERTGVMDALTKALVALYEEVDKPDDALGYIRSYLGGGAEENRGLKVDMADPSAPKEGGDIPSPLRKEGKPDSSRPMGAEGDGPFPKMGDGIIYEDGGKAGVPIPDDAAI